MKVGRTERVVGPRILQNDSPSDWPGEMDDEAFKGLPGDFVRLVGPNTEADHAALLGNFLVMSGVLFGREAFAIADGRRHFPVESLLVCGQTGSGRKGTASARVLPVLDAVEGDFRSRVLSGLSSGEGLVKGLSPSEGTGFPGNVRRFLALMPEFASLLAVMKREGNTLSAILREAWDGNPLRIMTRKEPLNVDNVNLSIVAHVTPEELLNGLTATDRCNGFANRFLLIKVRRSQLLPEGGTDVNLNSIVTRLRSAVEAARGRGQIARDDAARSLWAREYERLTREREGIRGALCGRAEAHVLRLSLLYALLDCSDVIRIQHLRAALAFWDFCERSVENIFGATSGDPDGEKILSALAHGPLAITDLFRLFSNHRDADWLQAKMSALVRSGKAVLTTKAGDRKSNIQVWALKGWVGE
jgi:hypothetical protein